MAIQVLPPGNRRRSTIFRFMISRDCFFHCLRRQLPAEAFCESIFTISSRTGVFLLLKRQQKETHPLLPGKRPGDECVLFCVPTVIRRRQSKFLLKTVFGDGNGVGRQRESAVKRRPLGMVGEYFIFIDIVIGIYGLARQGVKPAFLGDGA